jgi:hypothetical protein
LSFEPPIVKKREDPPATAGVTAKLPKPVPVLVGAAQAIPPVQPIELEQVVHRRKQRAFVETFAAKIADGVPLEDAKVESIQENFQANTKPFSKAAALRKANTLLEKKPWINLGLEMLFRSKGISPELVAGQHGDLIQTPDAVSEEQARAAQIRQKAIDSYWNLTIPKATQKVEIRSMSVLEVLQRPEPLAIDTEEK